ncbi:MAG: hypothetical protein QGD94_06420, partial [Planctomycetia bacterium]|nr:hypothetical protein [Planctomycetia bacterium]
MAFRNWKQELADQRPARPSSLPFFLWLVGGLLALAGAACIALWVWPGYMLPRPWRRPGPPPQSIALFFSSDIQGHIEPCGCTEQEWGGLARMSGFLKSIKEPATRLAFDVGRMAAGNLLWERLVWERCLQGLGHMEFTAANLGASEITLSAADIRRAADNSPVLLLSANVIDEATRKPIVQTHHQVIVDNLRVTVVGVVQAGPEDRLGAGVAIDDVHKSLGALLHGLRPATDVLILLAACDRNMMREIAEAHPEIDVILGGRVRHSSEQIEQVGTCRIAYHASKGQIIGRVDLQIREDGRPDAATSTMTLLDN